MVAIGDAQNLKCILSELSSADGAVMSTLFQTSGFYNINSMKINGDTIFFAADNQILIAFNRTTRSATGKL